MARRLRTNNQIDAFIANVIVEAQDHAPNVDTVIQPLSDEVRRRLDLSVDKIEVYERNGKLARTCWVTINGNRYVFSYNYQALVIDLRELSIQGAVRFQFDNKTSLAQIRREAGRL